MVHVEDIEGMHARQEGCSRDKQMKDHVVNLTTVFRVLGWTETWLDRMKNLAWTPCWLCINISRTLAPNIHPPVEVYIHGSIRDVTSFDVSESVIRSGISRSCVCSASRDLPFDRHYLAGQIYLITVSDESDLQCTVSV